MQRTRKGSDLTISSSEFVADPPSSPWKIKVTVEAEPEGNDRAETGKRQIITRTMKVPLHDDTSPKRNFKKTTAAKKAGDGDRALLSPRTTQSRRKSVTDLNMVVLGDDAEEDEWLAKPRSPRKRKNSKTQSTKELAPGTNSRTFEIPEDHDNVSVHDDGASQKNVTPEMRDVDPNEIALRTRSHLGNNLAKEPQNEVRKVSINSAMSYPTPSPTVSEHGFSEENYQSNDSNEVGVGLDTVMESEGFTMIDLDSLPSVKQMRDSPHYPTISEEEDEQTTEISGSEGNSKVPNDTISIQLSTFTEESSDLSEGLTSSPPNEGGVSKKAYSIGHLQLPSSTNVHRHRHVTPAPYSLPSLPSPPQAPVSVVKERSPKISNNAKKAGLILQDAVTPENLGPTDVPHKDDLKVKANQSLFGGFSSSTQRELRAELRFGEELGKKQILEPVETRNSRDESTREASTTEQLPARRSETALQRTPPVAPTVQNHILREAVTSKPCSSPREPRNTPHISKPESDWEARIRSEREEVIEEAKAANSDKVVVIESDSDDGNNDLADDYGEDETMGDIWLAEARNRSSSPQECTQSQMVERTDVKPRRTLIPSPWKRGEAIEADATSHFSGNESFTGLFQKQGASVAPRGFGAAIIANPNKVGGENTRYDRRRSGEFTLDAFTSRQPRRLSPRRDEEEGNLDDNDEYELDTAANGLEWRSASDVIEEETSMLEAERKLNANIDHQTDDPAGVTTRLYETNLEDISEQDLSSSPHLHLSKDRQARTSEHDSTYSSLSEDSKEELYRQRTCLSPSKERPNTPRSALKGGRASFGAALNYGVDSEEANGRKVVWAKRMSCMNEEWEESSRSIRSTQESFQDDTPTPLTIEKPQSQARQVQQHQSQFNVNAQPPRQEGSNKGWFGWFKQVKDTENPRLESQDAESEVAAQSLRGLDGSMDEFMEPDHDLDHQDSSYAPTSRHTSVAFEPAQTRAHIRPLDKAVRDERARAQDRSARRKSSSPESDRAVPSYLQPPSYPSDAQRDPSVPLTTSGAFTKAHFKTLHIIYRKALRPRFHGPSYPEEVRPELRALVDNHWRLTVDETDTMDDTFEFPVSTLEARVLERFMREVEHGYEENGTAIGRWGWSVEELAEKLGRVAIGEIVRKEERETRRILAATTT